MRIINKLLHWYNTYRMFCWLGGILTGVIIPFAGYGLYALQTFAGREEMMVDSPEYASDITIGSPWEWLTGMLDGYGWILGILALIGLVFVLFCIVFQIVSFVMRRTELSGTDRQAETVEKTRKRLDLEDTYDDYGAQAW